MNADEVMELLKGLQSPENRAGMARFGINVENAYGISVASLRKMARNIGKDHGLAQELWSTGVHEARLMAVMLAEPKKLDRDLMESWARGFNSWDLVDLTMIHLFRLYPGAHEMVVLWATREEEFIKRAGFALMATLAVHDKKAVDSRFEEYLLLVEGAADDGRNFVKKAVNWALRQIGKRNSHLHQKALETAARISQKVSRSARWIANDAIKELKGEKVGQMLAAKEAKRK